MSQEKTVWTRQHPAVLEELERCGRYVATEEAIRLKTGIWPISI